MQRQQFPDFADIHRKIQDGLFELVGIDECASGLWAKHYDCLNLLTDHSLQNVLNNILVLVDKFLVQIWLVNSTGHDDQKSIYEALVLGTFYDRADAEQIRLNIGVV